MIFVLWVSRVRVSVRCRSGGGSVLVSVCCALR